MPGTEEIQQRLSCGCHKECRIDTCICITNNLNFKDACHLLACDNNYSVEAEYYFNDEDEVK